MFDIRDRTKYNKVMGIMDKIIASYGRQKVKIAAQGFDKKWKLKNFKRV